MAETVAAKGFARTTVADVIAAAGVSRETFYEQFSDKEDCFREMLDAVAEALRLAIESAVPEPASDPIERLDQVLGVYLQLLVAAPAAAKAFLIDAFGAGPSIATRRIELQRRFAEQVAEILEIGDTESGRLTAEVLVAAVSSMVTARIGTGRVEELPTLRGPLIDLARRLVAT
jgi:AcrR family transcriptional regulator